MTAALFAVLIAQSWEKLGPAVRSVVQDGPTLAIQKATLTRNVDIDLNAAAITLTREILELGRDGLGEEMYARHKRSLSIWEGGKAPEHPQILDLARNIAQDTRTYHSLRSQRRSRAEGKPLDLSDSPNRAEIEELVAKLEAMYNLVIAVETAENDEALKALQTQHLQQQTWLRTWEATKWDGSWQRDGRDVQNQPLPDTFSSHQLPRRP